MDSNKSLIVKKDNIFTRIISFFKGLFKTRKIEKNLIEETVKPKVTRKDFLNSIKEEQDNPEILKLQQAYENNKINVEDISYEQILELNKLYKKQIKRMDEELKIKKVNLNILKKTAT